MNKQIGWKEEYGCLHNDNCESNRDDGGDCDCENIRIIESLLSEQEKKHSEEMKEARIRALEFAEGLTETTKSAIQRVKNDLT
jgi:hypothetical protein